VEKDSNGKEGVPSYPSTNGNSLQWFLLFCSSIKWAYISLTLKDISLTLKDISLPPSLKT